MADLQKDFLFVLIKSLSKSEKRNFKLYVNRLGINTDAKFLLLFNTLDKMNEYDEEAILQQKITTKQQLSNLKAHLYKQILVSLRLNPINQNNRIQLREQLDFATILYQKGLHKQSLKILDKTKQQALELQEKNIAYEIIELEKVIEGQYITRSLQGRAEELIQQSDDITQQNLVASKLSNLSLKLYSEMLTNGYARDDEGKAKIIYIFNEGVKGINIHQLEFREKLWFYKANVWKNLLIQDYIHAYKYAKLWVELFYQNPEMITNHPVWYYKGNTYLFKLQFLNGMPNGLQYWLEKFNQTTESENFPKTENINSLIFLTYYNNKINQHFLKGEFAQGTKLVKDITRQLDFYKDKIDDHHIFVLYLKIASLYFGSENYKESLEYCYKIIRNKDTTVQPDLTFNTRILALMAKYELQDDEDFEDFAKETLKTLQKSNAATDVRIEIVEFFIRLANLSPLEQKAEFKKFSAMLEKYAQSPFNKRAIFYLDVINWVEAKYNNLSVEEIVKNKTQKYFLR